MRSRVFGRSSKAGSALAALYDGGRDGDAGRWMRESSARQAFRDALADGEALVAVAEVVIALPGEAGRTTPGWAAVTDRSVHVRATLGPGIYQAVRLGYDQVRQVSESTVLGAPGVQISYFDARQAGRGSWRLALHLRETSGSELTAVLPRLIREHASRAQPA